MPKENPTDQSGSPCPIDRLNIPNTQPVRLTVRVSEVRQIPVKEERRVLWYASDE